MRKFWLFTIACMTLLMACEQGNNQSEGANIVLIDTLPYTYVTVEKTEQNTEVKDSMDLYTASISYPVVSGSALADSINALLQKTAFNNFSTAQIQVDSFVTTTAESHTSASFNGWYYSADVKILYNTPLLLSMEMQISEFTGGAHGSNTSLLYSLNNNGKQLQWVDLLETNAMPLLMQLNDSIMRKEQDMPAGTTYQDAGFLLETDSLPLPQFYALTKDGLQMHYNQYEIAPYAMGLISYTIPYNQLSGILQKSWMP
jgi:Deacetylase PdaC/Protein of unknown function (DUF3298)